MSKIVFNCNNATYATALEASITAETVTVTVDDTTVTVELATPADSFAIDAMSAKVFVDSLTVYATKPAPVEPSIELTHISLDTENDALGFKAVITGDLPEGAQVGIKMSVEGGKEITYLVDASKLKTSGVVTLRLKNIMSKNGGDMKITGTPVIVMGEETVTGTAATTSMKDTILAVNELKNLNASQMAAVGMYYDNNKAAMEPWFVGADGVAIENKIDAWYTAPSTEE